MRQKKGNLHYIIMGFMIVILLIVGFCIRKIGDVEKGIVESNSFEAREDFSKKQSDIMRDTSKYLTEQSKGYIFQEAKIYLERYCKEVSNTRSREKIIEDLEAAGLTKQELVPIIDAGHESDILMERELWAMRMIAEANEVGHEELPPLLQEVSLSDADLGLSSELQKEAARAYMLSPEYMLYKNQIDKNLSLFQEQEQERRNQSVDIATQKVKAALYRVQFYNILLVLVVSLEVVIFYAYVILPFMRYSKELEQIGAESGDVLKPGGFREMKIFANMFNRIYTDLLHEQKKLELLNSTDVLTGIANRAALEEYVISLLEEGHKSIGFLMMDVDNFKLFNDGFGHLIGDQVLVRMGQCFEEMAGKAGGIAGRLGGEEFIIVAPGATVDQVERIAANILDTTMNIDTKELGIFEDGVRVTVSVGSTIWPKGRKGDIKSMTRQADVALYQAKSRGKNQHVMYSEEEALFKRLEDEKMRQIEVESDMFRALEKEEFIPFFQPKYDLHTGRICGAEALVRWDHIDKGYLYPDYFVPVLEKDGFITRIDFAMFEKICSCISEWQEVGLKPVPIACNFSRLNFGKQTIVSELIAITEKYGVSPSLIQVELTENSLLEKEAAMKMEEELRELHTAGFSIAIDDFGTGYSSLGMLHELSVDVLKVDKSFLHRDLKLKANEMLLKGILYIAQTMKMETVVEGVETEDQVKLLKELGFRIVQGFYFSKPVEKRDFEKMMKEQGENSE